MEGSYRARLRCFSRLCLEGLKKTTKTLNQDI
jgi:hypothetical protein